MQELYRVIVDPGEAVSLEEILGSFRRLLAAPPPREFTLLNFYKGVRIEYPAEVVGVSEAFVIARVHPVQEAAIRVIGRTFAKGERFPCEVLADAKAPDPPDGTARLFVLRHVAILADRREFLRVQFSPPPKADVIHKGSRFDGRLLDVSPRSAAVLMSANMPLKDGYRARIRASVGAFGEGAPIPLDAEGDVVRIAEEGGLRRVVFALLPDPRVEHTVSGIVARRQMEILREMKELAGLR